METFKNNWKLILLTIFAILFLNKLEQLALNGRYVPAYDNRTILDTRNGKAYILVPDGKGNKLKEKGEND
jgi:hypothetical protein